MAKYNIIAKCVKGAEYLMTEMIATSLTKKQFEKIKELNKEKFADYRFIPYNDTDFSWWHKITKYMTKKYVYSGVCFDYDWFGNITKY